MKIRMAFIALLLLCCVPAAVLYVRANQSEGKQKIITEAMQKKDTPELIKALIWNMKEQLEVDEERFPELINEVAAYTAQCTDPVGKAVLHSMLAEMYNRYYQQNRWTINQRTEMVGYVPEAIQEWTSNLFKAKIKEELDASLADTLLLQKTTLSRFNPILTSGKDSPSLRPTLYSFLAFRALDMQPTDSLYHALITFQSAQGEKKAALLTELDFLQQQYANQQSKQTNAAYTQALDSLSRQFATEPYSVEIDIARLYQMERNPYAFRDNDSLRALQYALCTQSIARFPNYERIGVLKNALRTLEEPNLSVQAANAVYPGKPLMLTISYTNLSRLQVKVYRSKLSPLMQASHKYYQESSDSKMLGEFVQEAAFTLSPRTHYSKQDSSLALTIDKPGLYVCVVNAPGSTIKTSLLFSVSRLAALSRHAPNGQTEVLVTDFLSGKPIEGATVNYYNKQGDNLLRVGSLRTNRDGLATLPTMMGRQAYQATFPGDTCSLLSSLYPYGDGRSLSSLSNYQLSLFTDRGIYRPGQTVRFKGIAYTNDANNPRVVPDKHFTVLLRDANGKEVASKQCTTHAFGSFNGEFTLPAQALNGTFTLQAGEARAYIEVAEYKRPTFNLKLLPVKEEAVFNEPVTILGKAQTYSGVSLQSGTVNYRITECRLLRSYMRTPPKQVAQGETIVNTDGSFAITFCPEKEVEESLSPNAQLYEVTATLTDSKGETEETRTTVSVAAAGILLSLNLPENKEMEKDSIRMQASACTINGSAIRATGTYTLSPFTRSETEEKNVGKPVVEGSFTTDRPFDSAIFAKLPSGRYRICLTSVDSKGRTVTEQEDFILYSKHDKRPPIITPMWLVDERTTCLPGEEASFVFGTSEKKAYILYELFTNDKLIRRERLELSDENRTFRIPFEAEYGVGFVASFTFVKEGKFYTTQVPIYRRQPDRRLSIRPETFRDRLLPGSRETWKFHIQNADSTAMIAEVLAGMYDASLDRISPFAWSFSPIRQVVLTAPRMTGGAGFQTSYRYENQRPDFVAVPEYQYDCLNWQGMMSSNQSNITLRRYSGAVGAVMMKSASAPMAERQNNRLDVQEESVTNMAESVVEAPVSTPSLPQLRENFAETAFFYPALMTNETGDVSLDFILPESNTTWKMQLLAYTEDMKYGLLTREVISQKPLMVLPNLPRFLREGDQVTLTAQVMNQSGKELMGRARLELFDPANDQPVICLTKSEKPFVLPSDSTITVSWSLTVPSGISLIGCRMVADTDSGSDGEQLLIPVLSNELLITESTPFYLIGDGEQRIQLKESGRSVSRRPFKLTLEMSSNPIWYAVQALPTLTTPEDDNLLSWFASYYSNTLASYIVQTNPRLKKVIDQWTAQGGTAATLLSNLEKNAELKAILLSETPWVLSANNETEQKQRLALLFDLNRAASARMAALQQLQQQQQPDGGWSWMKGGRSSRSITLQVLKGMADLTALNAVEYNQEEKEMQIKALAFVDNCLRQDYEQAKKGQYLKKSLPTAEQLEYLYVRSAYRDIPEPGNAREAIRFYTNQAAKQWSLFSLYGKAETALLMHRNGQKATASAIFGWLRKTATVNMEMGMYWANNRREANYFTSPIDTHCLLMALFNELSPDTADTDRMKQWLLNQKRTQNWESVPATVNAIYALLLTGSDWLGDNNTCTVQWGSHAFNTVTGEAATGYIKEVIPAKEITPQMNILNVQKTGKAPAWGAIYNQYFEAIDQVAAQSGALRIDKKLFVETNSSAGRQIHPVTPNTPLCIGDKVVVRLTLSSDREMDYVALKDQRAGCFEPSGQLSGYEYRNGLSYYRAPGDVSENFYFDRLPKGTFVLEYSVYASRVGEYAGGVSTLQCLYAPEYVAHTAGERIRVNE